MSSKDSGYHLRLFILCIEGKGNIPDCELKIVDYLCLSKIAERFPRVGETSAMAFWPCVLVCDPGK